MAYPTYTAKGTMSEDTDSDVAPTYMGSIVAGNLLYILALNVQGTVGTISNPSGYSTVSEEIFSWGTIKLMRKVASGSESGTVTITRSGSTGLGTYFMAQIYQISAGGTITVEEEDPNSTTGDSTITLDAVTVGGALRTLFAFIGDYDGSGIGTPTGYSSNASDNSTLVSGMTIALKSKENVSSDGSVTTTGSSNGWASWHISLYIPVTGRVFVVN